MNRTSQSVREEAVSRVLRGESASSVAVEIGVKPGTLRQWLKRHRDADGDASLVVLAPPVDLSGLTVVELLEHDIASVRRQIRVCEESGTLTALAPLWRQVRSMESELRTLRDTEPEDRADTNAEIFEELISLMRVKFWVRGVLDDRQCRLAYEAVQRERTP